MYLVSRGALLSAGLAVLVAATPSAPSAPTAPVPAASPAATASTSVTVPGGTHLKVAVTQKISSGTAAVGDKFAFQATEDVAVGGWVVVQEGAAGEGEVLSVEHAGSHGKAGNLGLQLNWVYAVDGEKMKLTSQRTTAEGKNEAGVSSTMTIASFALLGLPGLFAHNWVKGHEIELDATHPLDAYVLETVHVASTVKSDTPDAGFAH
jgi:hypothetical protein